MSLPDRRDERDDDVDVYRLGERIQRVPREVPGELPDDHVAVEGGVVCIRPRADDDLPSSTSYVTARREDLVELEPALEDVDE